MVLAPFVVLGLWARYFFVDVTHITTLDNPAMPIWDFLIDPYLSYSRFTAALASFVLVLVIGFTISRLASRFGILRQQSMMMLIMFSLLSSAFFSVQKLSPFWFFVLFFVLGLERIFVGVQKRNGTVNCFDGAFLVGLGSLFYIKGVFFFPLLLVSIGMLRLANFKSVLASFIGLLLPFILSFAWYFFFNKSFLFVDVLSENLASNPGQYNHGVFSRIYMGFMILLTSLSILMVVRKMGTQKVVTRRYYRVFVWIILFSSAAVLTPFFSVEVLPLFAVGAAFTIISWLESVSNNLFKEMVFLLIFVFTIAGQFLLF